MRSKTLAIVAALLLVSGAACAQPLSLTEALRLAESSNPAVRAREAQLAAIEGSRREAAPLLFNNPSLTAERTHRRVDGPDASSREWNVGVAQPFELGGQQTRRREAASAALDAVHADIDDARRQARADATLRFYSVLAAQRRVEVEQRSAELFDTTAQVVAKRRAAGEDTRLDANVASIEAERARNALAVARERLLDSRSELATALQLPPGALPEVVGQLDLSSTAPAIQGVDSLLSAAMALPRRRALSAREDAARARLSLERANRYPDLTVGLNVGREGPRGSRERLTTLSLSLPLPLMKRNDAAIGQALTDLAQAEVERASGQRETLSQIRRLWTRLSSQRGRVQRLQQAMVPPSTDNQQLAAKSRQAGQIGLLEQLVINRQVLEAERELNDALADYHATRIELEHAAGVPLEGASR